MGAHDSRDIFRGTFRERNGLHIPTEEARGAASAGGLGAFTATFKDLTERFDRETLNAVINDAVRETAEQFWRREAERLDREILFGEPGAAPPRGILHQDDEDDRPRAGNVNCRCVDDSVIELRRRADGSWGVPKALKE